MSKQRLTQTDVTRLLSDPSPDTRVDTAEKLAQQFEDRSLTDADRQMIEDIFRIMVRDAEVRVRAALASNLKENSQLPHDVALTLANDVDSVALPVLQFSEVLTPQDLMEIVESQGETKQTAIAGRAHVDAQLAERLVEKGGESAVATLVGNAGAKLSDESLGRVVDRFGDSEQVQGPLVGRSRLPVTVAERLMARVSETLREQLLTRHELPADMATDLVMQSRERATIGLSTESSEDEVERLVTQLEANHRLTPSIVTRAAVMGDLKFMEYALSCRAGIPVVNARILIHDSGSLGLQGLFQKAGLPPAHFPAVRAAVSVAHETEYDGRDNDRERFSRRMIERVLTQYGDLGVEFESDDLEYLMGKMNQLPSSLQQTD